MSTLDETLIKLGRDALRDAVRAVRAIHQPIDALNARHNIKQQVCTGCGTDDGNWQVWPCPTVRAITEALALAPAERRQILNEITRDATTDGTRADGFTDTRA